MEQLFAELLAQFRGLQEMQDEHRCSLRFLEIYFEASGKIQHPKI
jgi:hypothetical protein